MIQVIQDPVIWNVLVQELNASASVKKELDVTKVPGLGKHALLTVGSDVYLFTGDITKV